MEFIHIQKNIHHTPRKLRLVADLVRKMTPEQALSTLRFTKKAVAIDLAKAIKTALANVGSKPNLTFRHLEINEGTKIKRGRPAPMGRIRPYMLRFAQIKVVLTDEVKPSPDKIEKSADETIAKLNSKGGNDGTKS